ncbi:MAG TPA: SAM-dependent methyltransferase [Actinocrinis sp.]|uniref:SAM-dependent methyltransferase n=1 Tax=Actinocrinis sp. TaxID=1920516 RepID=UPI002DDDA0B6|nr:SAM-dependent methyltransferase [Actinocrinis sp.]HEV3169062.1 SAM-dependent methyltransferase [Actinocrinis sp.]
MTYGSLPSGAVPGDRPHPARIYDYLLGGRDNYELDRDAAHRIIEALPRVRAAARENRAFLHRAVRAVVRAGIRQIIDIGTGIPTSPNTHEVAQALAPRTRVVYVDNDPIVGAHAHARLTNASHAAFASADLRDPWSILDHPVTKAAIDFDKPVAVFLVAVLHFITDAENPAATLAALRDAMAPGSCLALTHASGDDVDNLDDVVRVFRGATSTINVRSRARVLDLFDGFDLIDPGLVSVAQWRPEEDGGVAARFSIYAGVGFK